MKKIREKKPFKREYIPVIIAGIILVLLLVALVWVILWRFKKTEYKVEKNPADIQEVLIDSANYATNMQEYEKLVEEAKKIKISYELKNDYLVGYEYPEDWGEQEGEDANAPVPHTEEFAVYDRYFAISIKDVDPENLYIVHNDSQGVVKDQIIHSDPADREILIRLVYTEKVDEHTIDVREAKGSDQGILLRRIKFKTPRYNYYFETDFCKTYPDNKYCSETTYESISPTKYEREVLRLYKRDEDSNYKKIRNNITGKNNKKEETKEEEKFMDKVINLAKKNIVVTIIIGVVIVLGVAATIIFTKKKKRSSIR